MVLAGHQKDRRRTAIAVVLVILLVSAGVGAGGLASAGTPTATATTAAPSGAPATALLAGHEGVPGGETDPTTANTANTTAEMETYLLVLEENLTIGPIQTAADVTQAKQDTERAQAPILDRLAAKDINVTTQLWITNAIAVTVDPARMSPADLQAIDGVTRVEPNLEFQQPEPQPNAERRVTMESAVTTDSLGETTYGLTQMNVDGFVEAYQTNGSGTRVAILDNGLNESHPDLQVTRGVNVSNGVVSDPATTTLQQADGHGDHVAGIATGTTTPVGDIPRYSVAPDAALLKADVFVGGAKLVDILAAIQWAVEADADVISMSLSISASDTESTILLSVDDAVETANNAGTVVVGSAGNTGSGGTGGPVRSPGAEFPSLSVGATDAAGDVASFSAGTRVTPDTAVVLEDGSVVSYPARYPHRYVKPDVTAPGVSVVSAGPLGSTQLQAGPTYSSASGTSMAAPHVAGAVALLQSATPTHREPDVLMNALVETATKPGDPTASRRDSRYGMGIIDVLAARNALETTTTIDGRVTSGGDTLTGAAVTTDSGVIAATDGGTYAIEPTTDATTVAVTANDYGYVPATTAVPTGGNETIDFTLNEIESLHVELAAAQIETTATTNVTVIATHADGTESAITDEAVITTSNSSVARVTETNVTGVGTGTTTVTARYDGFTGETTVAVRDQDGIELSVDGQQDAVSIRPGESVGYTINATFDDGSTKEITNSTPLTVAPGQNAAALTIDTNAATITGAEVAENVTVIADDGSFEARSNVTVTEPTLETVALELSQATVTTNNSVTATVTGTYTDGSTQLITDNATIRVADDNIAAITNTTLTGIRSGTTTITATVNNKTATATLTVLDPAVFNVTVTDSPASVVEGEPLTLNYTVTNTGDQVGTQAITVSVNGTEQTRETLQLEANATATRVVTYQTQSGDAPTLSIEIASANVTTTTTVPVQTPPQFAVAITSINESVVEGDIITAEYTVTNTGDATGTQPIDLLVNDTVEATDSNVTVQGGTSTTETVSYQTQSGDAPSVAVAIASDDTTATESVRVNQPPRFGIGITSINDSVVENDTIVAEYAVANTGGVAETQTVALHTNGTVQHTTNVTLPAGATKNGTLAYQTQPGDAPALNISITTADQKATAVVGVAAPAAFAVTINQTASTETVTEPDPFVTAAQIENEGTLMGTESITYTLRGNEAVTATNTTNVTLAGQTTQTVMFTTATSGLEPGEYRATVDSRTDTDTHRLTLKQERTASGGGGGGGGSSGSPTGGESDETTGESDAGEPSSTPEPDPEPDNDESSSTPEKEPTTDDEESTATSSSDTESDGQEPGADTEPSGDSEVASNATNNSDQASNESETETDVPGFGVGVAVVAVLIMTRLATRW